MGIANQLTLARLYLSPVFVLFFALGGRAGYIAALLLAGVFELTDMLDGYLARSKKETSDFGKLLDPLADSVARFSVFLCFLWGGFAELWAVAVLFYRDAIVAYTRVAAAKAGVVLAARLSGKVKAVVQGLVIMAVLVLIVLASLGEPTAMERTKQWTTWLIRLVAAVTLWSGVDYLFSSVPMLRRLMAKSPQSGAQGGPEPPKI